MVDILDGCVEKLRVVLEVFIRGGVAAGAVPGLEIEDVVG